MPHLIRALQSPAVGGLEVDAAAAAADPRLLPALWALQRAGVAEFALGTPLREVIETVGGGVAPGEAF